jgi:maleylacetoacetate isomerase
MQLFSYWRSLASFRVRIALNLKGLSPVVTTVNLETDMQLMDAYRKVNPQMMLPALVDGDGPVLFQSLAIIEYLDEVYPQPPLLPADPRDRARVRGLAQMVACEGHPLLTPRVRKYLEHELKLDAAVRQEWPRHWIIETLKGLEGHLAGDASTGQFCHGNTPTLADICMVGHVTAAINTKCDLAPYPTVKRIFDASMALPAFAKAHPLAQADTPEELRPKT